jgi:hypothetical protein
MKALSNRQKVVLGLNGAAVLLAGTALYLGENNNLTNATLAFDIGVHALTLAATLADNRVAHIVSNGVNLVRGVQSTFSFFSPQGLTNHLFDAGVHAFNAYSGSQEIAEQKQASPLPALAL